MRNQELKGVVARAIDERVATAVRWLIVEDDTVLDGGAQGGSVGSTIFDLASLTKPLCTLALLLLAFDRELVSPATPIAALFPELSPSPLASLSLGEVASHTSGLPAWLPLYALMNRPTDLLDWLVTIPLKVQATRGSVYSDLGYLLLGLAIERIFNDTLSNLFAREIARPLHLTTIGFTPQNTDRCLPTEFGNTTELLLATPFLSSAIESERCQRFRNQRAHLLCGEVHDGNCSFLGGVAGHAGLFGTVEDVATIASAYLPLGKLFSEASRQLARRPVTSAATTPAGGELRAFGFELGSHSPVTFGNCTAGEATFSPLTFGHNGFVGTSFWVDPERHRVYVLLATRTFPYDKATFNEFRRRFFSVARAI